MSLFHTQNHSQPECSLPRGLSPPFAPTTPVSLPPLHPAPNSLSLSLAFERPNNTSNPNPTSLPQHLAHTPTPRPHSSTPRPPPVSITPTLRNPSNTPSISALLSGSAAGKDLELLEKRDSDRRTGRTDCLAIRPSGCGLAGGQGGRDRWGNRWGIENHVLSPVISERTEPTHTSISSPTSSMATCLSLCSVASRAHPRTRPGYAPPPPSSHSHSSSRPSSAVPIPGRYPPSETTISLHSTRPRTDSLPPPVRLPDLPASSPTDLDQAGPTPAPPIRPEEHRLSKRRAKEEDTRRRDLEFAARQAAKRAEKERRDQMVSKRDRIVKKLMDTPSDAKLVRDLGKLYLQNNEAISRPSRTLTATGARSGTSRRGSEPSLKLAIHYLEQSIQLNSRDPQTWLYLGRAWALLQAYPAMYPAECEQRLSNASLGYRKAITLAAAAGQPRQTNGYRLAFAEYLEGLARHEEAAGVLQEALSEMDEVECWWELGRMMELWALEEGVEIADRAARMGHACEAYKRATQMEPGDEMMRLGRAEGEKLLDKLRAQLREDQTRPGTAKLTDAGVAHRPVSATGTEKRAGASAAELKRLVANMATIPEFGQKLERVASSPQPAGIAASSVNGLASNVEANRTSVPPATDIETYASSASTPQASAHKSARSTHQAQVDRPAAASTSHCQTYSADSAPLQVKSDPLAAAPRAHPQTHLTDPLAAHVQPDPSPLVWPACPDTNQSDPVIPPLQSDSSAMVSQAPRETCHSDAAMANSQPYSPSASTHHLQMNSPATSTPGLPAYSSTASTPHLTYSSTASTPHLQTNPSVVPTPHLEMHSTAAPTLHYQKYPSTVSTPHLTYSSTASTPHMNTNSSTAPTTRPETEERMVKTSVTLISESAASCCPSPNSRAKSESKGSKIANLSPTNWPDHVQTSSTGPPSEILKAPEGFQFSPPGCRSSIQHAGQRLQRLAKTSTPNGSPAVEGLQSSPLIDNGPCLSSYRPPSPSALPTPMMQSLGSRLGTPKQQISGSPLSSASSGRQAGKKIKEHRRTDGHSRRMTHGPSLSLGALGQGRLGECCHQHWVNVDGQVIISSEPSGQFGQGGRVNGVNGKMEIKIKEGRGGCVERGSADRPPSSVVGREEWGGTPSNDRHGDHQSRGVRASTRVNGRVEFKASANHDQSINVQVQNGKARSTRVGSEQDRKIDPLGPPPVIPPRPFSCLTTSVGTAVEAEARPGSRSGAGVGVHRTTRVPMTRAETARPYDDSGQNSEQTANYNYSLIDAHLQSIVEIDSRRRSELKELRRQFDRTDEWAERRRTEVVDQLRRLCGSVGGGRRRKGSGSGTALSGGGRERCNSTLQQQQQQQQQHLEGADSNGRISVGGNGIIGLESAGYALNGIASIIQLVQQQQQQEQEQIQTGEKVGFNGIKLGGSDQKNEVKLKRLSSDKVVNTTSYREGIGKLSSSEGDGMSLGGGGSGGGGGKNVHYHHQQQSYQQQQHQQQHQHQHCLVDPMRLMMTTTTTTSTDL